MKTWGHLCWLLVKDKARNLKVVTSIYCTVIQAQLPVLYGSETWVVSNRILRMLDTFHRRCAQFLTRDFIRRLPDGDWVYPRTTEFLISWDYSQYRHIPTRGETFNRGQQTNW